MSDEKKSQLAILDKQCDRVINWITFAEAKNAALIALNIASMTVVAEIFDNTICWGAITLILFIISTGISLVSFYPNNSGAERDNSNILNYANVSLLLNSKSYLDTYSLRYEDGEEMNYENLKKDISNQIYNNSKIALKKNNYFKYALITDAFAFMTFFIFIAQVVGFEIRF